MENMKISSDFNFVDANYSKVEPKSQSSNFDSYLKGDKKSEVSQNKKNISRKDDTSKNNVLKKADKVLGNNDETDADNKNINAKETNKETENVKDTQAKGESEKVDEAENTVDKVSELEKEKSAEINNLLTEIANLLNINEDDLLKVLESQGVSVEDLQDTKVIKEVISLVMEITDETELVANDEFLENFKNIKSLVNEFSKEVSKIDKAIIEEMAKNEDSIPAEEKVETVSAVNSKMVNFEKKEDNILTITEEEPTLEPVTLTNQGTQDSDSSEHEGEKDESNLLNKNTSKQEPVDLDKATTPQGFEFKNQIKGEVAGTEFISKTLERNNVDPKEVISQITEKIKIDIKSDYSSEVKMILKPESLGEVTVKITTQNGIVTAQFLAESQRVKEIIEANFNSLKDVLEEQGVMVNNFNASLSENTGGENNQAETGYGNRRSLESEGYDVAVDENEILQETKNYDKNESSISYTA